MVFFNYATMQMAAKIVYYGPGLCGKTTNLHHIYGRTSPGSPRRDGLSRDGDRPHALLRPPAPRRRRHRRLQDPGPALHGPRPGLLQHDAQAGPQGRRRHRLRRRLAARDEGRQRREPEQSALEPRRDRAQARRPSARLPVQQARPGQHPSRREELETLEPGAPARKRTRRARSSARESSRRSRRSPS